MLNHPLVQKTWNCAPIRSLILVGIALGAAASIAAGFYLTYRLVVWWGT